MRVELRKREKAFVTNQLKRDHELIKLMEIREKDMELNLLQKAEAFGYLYKEHNKEIKATIQKRDEELESTLNYREKLWTESINLVNKNMIKMYQAQGEFEEALNSIGKRQNELIKQHTLTQEWYLFNKGEISSVGKPKSSIPEFTPSQGSYKLEPVNLKPSKAQRKKK